MTQAKWKFLLHLFYINLTALVTQKFQKNDKTAKTLSELGHQVIYWVNERNILEFSAQFYTSPEIAKAFTAAQINIEIPHFTQLQPLPWDYSGEVDVVGFAYLLELEEKKANRNILPFYSVIC